MAGCGSLGLISPEAKDKGGREWWWGKLGAAYFAEYCLSTCRGVMGGAMC